MMVATVVGARPQFVKAAAVSKALERANIKETLIHTGQHFDHAMSDIFFEQLRIKAPDFNLGISGGNAVDQVSQMMPKIAAALTQIKPTVLLVYGDTNSTLAAALTGRMLHIPVVHVEAGLRSYNLSMPEELNRTVTDTCSDLLFAPTEAAVEELKKSGVHSSRISLVGDVMLDIYLSMEEKIKQTSEIYFKNFEFKNEVYALVTLHRAENVDRLDRLTSICQGLNNLSKRMRVIFPVHPRTKLRLKEFALTSQLSSNIHQMEPLGYLELQALLSRACLAVTDSGGFQKEAYFSKVPCITVRTETEWVELVDSGWMKLVDPTKAAHDLDLAAALVMENRARKPHDFAIYGSGLAADKIASHIAKIPLGRDAES